jgi:CysZ protein
MESFLSALRYPFRGIGYLLRRPALWKYFAAAVLINVALFAVLIVLFLHYRQDLIDAVLPARWWHWLRAGLGWLLTAVVFVAFLFLFTFVGNMLAAPFLDLMTERILTEQGETLPPPRGPLRALGRSLVNQTLKLVFFGAVQFALLLLHLIPVAGTALHPLLSTLVGVAFLGFEYLDYPLDARRVPVPGRFVWLWRRLGAALGFGTVLLPVLLVPVVGYVVLPLAVAGASLMVHDIDSPAPRV